MARYVCALSTPLNIASRSASPFIRPKSLETVSFIMVSYASTDELSNLTANKVQHGSQLTEVHPLEDRHYLVTPMVFFVHPLDKQNYVFVDVGFRFDDIGHCVDSRDGPFEGSMGLGILTGQQAWEVNAFQLGPEGLPVIALKNCQPTEFGITRKDRVTDLWVRISRGIDCIYHVWV